ncbi:MAG: hypothetical protein WBA41_26940 [Rivularia sp. (in: cyanobacteria)]
MSEVPKFDLSRIRVGSLPDRVKADETASQKTNTPDTAKVDEIASQKTNTPDAVKLDETATLKINTPDTAKVDEIASQKTNIPDTAKADEIASQKANTSDTVKTDEIASQKTKFSGEEQKNITESAKEIQALLAPLQATYPTKSDYEKQVFVNKFREEIKTNFRVQKILIAGGNELIEIVCQPLGIPIEMGKKWLETAKRHQ